MATSVAVASSGGGVCVIDTPLTYRTPVSSIAQIVPSVPTETSWGAWPLGSVAGNYVQRPESSDSPGTAQVVAALPSRVSARHRRCSHSA
jgi:hypothetical protein